MLAVETTDNWAWSCFVAADGHLDSYAASATVADACTSVTAFVAWLNDPARAWHATRAWTWSWARGTNSGAVLTLLCTGDFLFLGTAAPVGFATSSAAPTLTGTSSAVGTWAPLAPIAVNGHARLLGEGDCGGGNAIRPGVPGHATYKLTIAAVGNTRDACRLTTVLATASCPRRASVWQLHTATWRRYALGEVSRDGADNLFRFTLNCMGEVT